ncbi:MAG: hypothetical protein HKN47_24505 [Pirellulaceae bacterium]|nr:hypothetical protein [Pirellulaceae bacterium]
MIRHVLFVVVSFSIVVACAADQPLRPDGTQDVAIDDLPEPTEPVANLIEAGNVTFCTGQKPWKAMDKPQSQVALAKLGYQLEAETKLDLHCDYRSRTRWRIRRDGSQRILLITISYKSVGLKHRHDIWLKRLPAKEKFWSDRVVLHELDHVRISSNPYFAKRFTEKLRETKILRHPLSDGDEVGDEMVNRLVDEHVHKIYREISELVSIRYKELDRITRHGIDPIPAESKLTDWLQHDD